MKTKEAKGITLIALVVTIIILMILAGVTVSSLTSENGVINKAGLARKMTETSNEQEAIELDVTLANMENRLDNSNKYYIGEKLYDRNLENGDKWNIVVENDSQKVYGTGWSFIAKDTDIQNYGKTKYSWIVNYNSGEIKQINDNYTNLSYKSSLAVTDGLMFNMDATNVTNDKSTWGDNVSLRYFDDTIYDTVEKRTEAYNEESKYSNVSQFEGYDRKVSNDVSKYIDTKENAFKFNGNNYVEIYNKDGFDFSKGFTIELYGNFKDYVYATDPDAFLSVIGIWNGIYSKQCETRFGYSSNKYICYSLSSYYSKADVGSWSSPGFPWNQKYSYNNFTNSDQYMTITFNYSNSENMIQTIYINGKKLDEGWLDKEYYDEFIKKGKNLNYIELGRCTMTKASNWCYTKGVCYTARLYNRGLSAEEVSKNVTQTKLYRETIQK